MRFLFENCNRMAASSVSAEAVSARSFARLSRILADSAIIAESVFASIMLSIYSRTMLIPWNRVGLTA